MSDEPIDLMLAALAKAADLKTEIKRLRAIEEWAILQLPYRSGDEVTLVEDFSPHIDDRSGWFPHREHLVPGATGVVTQIVFGVFNGCWLAYYQPDVEWTVSTFPDKHSVSMVKPERRHLFMLHIGDLRKRSEQDQPLVPPEEAST